MVAFIGGYHKQCVAGIDAICVDAAKVAAMQAEAQSLLAYAQALAASA